MLRPTGCQQNRGEQGKAVTGCHCLLHKVNLKLFSLLFLCEFSWHQLEDLYGRDFTEPALRSVCLCHCLDSWKKHGLSELSYWNLTKLYVVPSLSSNMRDLAPLCFTNFLRSTTEGWGRLTELVSSPISSRPGRAQRLQNMGKTLCVN